MVSDLLTRAGSSLNDSLVLELLNGERFEELKDYIGRNSNELPRINRIVYRYLSDLSLTELGKEKARRIIFFGREYSWNEWKSLGINNI
jgi:hypothetical protein